MSQIFADLIGWVIFTCPPLLIALDIVFFIKKKERPIFELIAFFLGGIYMSLAYTIWELPEYNEALNIFGSANIHTPVSREHLFAVVLFSCWGFMSYFILKFWRKSLPPAVEVFLLAGVYVGIALCAAWVIQLFGPKFEVGVVQDWKPLGNPVTYAFSFSEVDVMILICLLIVPFIYVAHCVHLLYRIVKERAEKQALKQYDGKLLGSLNTFLLKGTNLFWCAVVALLPLLGILVMLLILFGQQPDSIILAFTKTSDWTLSKEISPPPVAYDTHYLCTVSLRGHRKLVKPTRYGIRRGEKIVVNRQLCIANAFEQLIQERTPKLHRRIREFYDRYGYPVSKHIRSAWAADVVYIIMKPLEWFFLLILYLCDTKPENRINSQYLPDAPCCK